MFPEQMIGKENAASHNDPCNIIAERCAEF